MTQKTVDCLFTSLLGVYVSTADPVKGQVDTTVEFIPHQLQPSVKIAQTKEILASRLADIEGVVAALRLKV